MKKFSGTTRVCFRSPPWLLPLPCAWLCCQSFVFFYNAHEAFCSAPGVDASSGEWDQMYMWLGEFTNAIDGDFKKFDTLLRGDVMQAVYWIVHRIMNESGKYSPVEIGMVYAAIMECCYIIINFFGDVVQLTGINSSGNAATVFFNCLANLIILRYIYARLNPNKFTSEDFLQFVRLMLYGDDNLSTVSDDIPWFNFESIQRELAKLGITYTPAKKSEGTYRYKKLEDTEFLKRGFTYQPHVNRVMGSLNLESIAKMVMVMIPSTTVSRDKQVVDMCASAVREAFLHGEELHASVTKDLRSALDEAGIIEIPDYTFPSYAELMSAYIEKSNQRDFFKGSVQPGRFKTPISASGGVESVRTNQTTAELESYCATIAQKMASVAQVSNL
ncbi:MAG: RNA-dependent RNA polymerase family protein, partial [Candidatus Bathyarchaeota archaeon]|nr:RNA-dependent RNA polymerase family protein [Candidatus Bathyarchaeota archaeon]